MKNAAVAMDKKWQAESDLRTLLDAREIQKDAKRMTAVRKLARERAELLETLNPPEKEK